jgi:hypothetical protein
MSAAMIALFCLYLTLSVSLFKSKSRLEAENAAVCTENSDPDVLVMKTAE